MRASRAHRSNPLRLSKSESVLIDGYAVHARIDLLGALKNGVRVQMTFGAVHDFQQNAPLTRQSHAALLQRRLQAAGTLVGVNALPGGNAMCGVGGHKFKCGTSQTVLNGASTGTVLDGLALAVRDQAQNVIVHNDGEHQQQKHHADGYEAFLDANA